MATNIVMHTWNEKQVEQRLVDGFVSLTDICRAGDKRVGDYLKLPSTKAYIDGLAKDLDLLPHQVVIKKPGRYGSTFAHPEIAIDCAQWISVPFRIWANRVLRQVIAGDFQAQTAGAAIAQHQLKKEYKHVLDQADPWIKMYEPEFCRQVYTWYGPQFYWTFCYCFLTPIERCKIDQLNPVVNGERKYRIHQFLPPEVKAKLTPYVGRLMAIIDTADGDKQTFIAGYQKHFEGIDQPRLF